jgi:hypothetical protein
MEAGDPMDSPKDARLKDQQALGVPAALDDPYPEVCQLLQKLMCLTEVATSYILVPGETPPHQTCKHKRHIKKVMCLTAVVRPQQNCQNGEWWDGKIGTCFF